MTDVPHTDDWRVQMLADLGKCVDLWLEESSAPPGTASGASLRFTAADLAWERQRRSEQAQVARQSLHHLLDDHRQSSAATLLGIAEALSPGGTHDGGFLACIIIENLLFECAGPVLAALVAHNWHGGKVGFQFLPDPAQTPLEDYDDAAEDLMFSLKLDGAFDPRRLCVDNNLAFFDSLPARFTVYRGAAGISTEMAAAGVCWTTSRDVAEWFAMRSAGFNKKAPPVLLSARVGRHEVALAKATEFEIVARPTRARVLKCRRRPEKWKPEMEWTPGAAFLA